MRVLGGPVSLIRSSRILLSASTGCFPVRLQAYCTILLQHVRELAELLDAWEVLRVCGTLEHAGTVVKGHGGQQAVAVTQCCWSMTPQAQLQVDLGELMGHNLSAGRAIGCGPRGTAPGRLISCSPLSACR